MSLKYLEVSMKNYEKKIILLIKNNLVPMDGQILDTTSALVIQAKFMREEAMGVMELMLVC